MAPVIALTEEEQRLRQLLLDVTEYIGSEAGKSKPQLRFAGGWVRDKLLGIGSNDIDIAVDNMTGLTFATLMKDFAEQSSRASTYGEDIVSRISKIPARPEQSKHLETATLTVFGLEIDIANLRKETYSEESRNPQMEFGTPEEDALRRDATVNALFYNLHNGQVEDFTGKGLDDMQKKIIRTPLPPYQTFKDDPLRVLRCIRFASRLDYTIDADAEQCMSNPEILEALRLKISRERVGVELEKMLKGKRPRTALAYIDRFGLYNTIFTDPFHDTEIKADTTNWSAAYDLLYATMNSEGPLSEALSTIKSLLVVDKDEVYLAWLLCALAPWTPLVSPHEYVPKKRAPHTLAALVAREGLKIDNKSRDVVEAATLRLGHVISLKDSTSAEAEDAAPPAKRKREPISREELGMMLHDWGPSWRTSVLMAMLVESIKASKDERNEIVLGYKKLVSHIDRLGLLDAHKVKPAVDGKRLMKEVGRKPGTWMTEAVRALLRWQFRNPGATDPASGISEIVAQFREKP